jgi:PAS domain S-box-containing protein
MHRFRLPSRNDITQSLIWVGVGISLLYWFLESWIHVVIFKEGFLVSHIFTPDPHELWKRSLVISLLIFFSFYAQRSINIRQRTENALALALGEMDQIFQTASVGMRVIDPNFNVLKVNKTFETITGVPADEAVGKKCYEIFAGPKCFTLDCPLILILNGTDSVECHVEKKRPNGSIVPCILTATPFTGPDGALDGIVESFKDITELEKAKEAIRKKRDKLQGILSHMKEGVSIVNLNHEVEFQNITHKKFIGEMEGTPCYRAFHNRNAPCTPCLMRESIATGTTMQFEFETSNDKSFEQAYTPIIDIDGKPKAVALLRDVTREKNAMAAMMQAEQLAALGELAAGVAHEINNPINGVINYAQIIVNKYSDHSLIKDIAERVIKEGNRIARIVEGLLFFSRSRKEEKTMTFINEVLSDSLTLAASQLRKDNIILDADIHSELPPVIAQAHEIEQVFINLISNARYALNHKYPNPDANKILQIRAETVNNSEQTFIKVSFLDHGIGIPDELMEKIRNPFFTTKKGRQSTGLGLSISHGIVEDHGGLLTIESCENEYTNISVNLPIHRNNETRSS